MERKSDPNKEFMKKKTKNLHRYMEFRKEVLAGKFPICRETERDMNDIDNIIIDILARNEDLY